MKYLTLVFLSLFFISGLIYSCGSSSDGAKPTGAINGPIFELLSAEETGVSFANNIVENERSNHLIWSHIYSGAGVAVGDINNDGLMDIFFSGNMVADALYLNKGGMKFEEITIAAGILNDNGWSVGATFGDVNGDGFDDIYVCRLGSTMDPEGRRNILYINNGDNTFTNQAKSYGVDDGGFSIQSSFFDMDNDGDLDLFVANQPPDPRLVSREKLDPVNNQAPYLDKLYRNTGQGKFVEISKHIGVGNYGYGLNVMASDFNDDGWVDLYVSNDYDSPDFLYMNNGDLTFTNTINESIKHISNFAMGSDVADYDNDGLMDIAVVDMASSDHIRSKTNMGSMRPAQFWKFVEDGKHYQYMFNTLQKNNGNGSFSEVGQMAGMSKTDWSWCILMADFDNDSHKDIAITNGIQRDIRNNDFQYKIKKANEQGIKDFNIMSVVHMVPSVPISNFIFQNNGDMSFDNVTKGWGFENPGFSNGMAYADFDNDGDLDLVINNVSETASIYENKQANKHSYIRIKLEGGKGNPHAYNAKVWIKYEEEQQVYEITSTRGFMSASEPIAHFGLGDRTAIDKLEIRWPNGKWTIVDNPEINKTHTLSIATATENAPSHPLVSSLLDEENKLQYLHQENTFDDFERETLIPHKQSENGPYMATGDVNGDGVEDFFIGGSVGNMGALYVRTANGGFQKSSTQPWSVDKEKEDLGCLFFDADNDNDLDLYVVSGGSEFAIGDSRYQDRLYKNDGKGNFTKATLPLFNESGQCVIAADYDGDGDQDLFVGGRLMPGKYPAPANSYLLINENGTFVDKTDELAPELRNLGLVTDAIFADYDGDKDLDLIAVGEWMGISVFRNDGEKLIAASAELGLENTNAWWWSIESGDFDEDGDVDFIVGNLGENTKFKATEEKPFMIYGNDFDNNGTNDVVLANYYGDKVVPIRGRQCSSEQMPFIEDKFETFEDFATASLASILPEEGMSTAVNYEIRSFKSIFLRNDGGHFEKITLPAEAQIAPLRDMLVMDLNKDGYLDILGVGNLYAAEVETMRYDAGIGICLMGDGKGNFNPLTIKESGFFAPFDARSISILKGNNPVILVGNNQAKLQTFSLK